MFFVGTIGGKSWWNELPTCFYIRMMDFLIATPFEAQKSNNQNANCRPWWEDSHRKERALDHHSQQEIQCHADNSRVSRLSLPSCEWCAKSQIHQCHSLHQLSFFAISTCNWSSKFMGVHGISWDFMWFHDSFLASMPTYDSSWCVQLYHKMTKPQPTPVAGVVKGSPLGKQSNLWTPRAESLQGTPKRKPLEWCKTIPKWWRLVEDFWFTSWLGFWRSKGWPCSTVSGRTKEQIFVFLKNDKKTKRQRKNCDINTRGGKSVIKCDKMEQAYSSPAGLQILQVELPACGQSCWPPKSRTRWPDWAGVIFFCNHGHHKGGIDLCFGAHQNLSIASAENSPLWQRSDLYFDSASDPLSKDHPLIHHIWHPMIQLNRWGSNLPGLVI